MRWRSLSPAGACAAALLLGACSAGIGGAASPVLPGSGTDRSDVAVDAVIGDVRLPGDVPPDRRPALLAADPGGDVVAFLRQLADEGGDLSTALALSLVTGDTDGGAPAEELPGVVSEVQVPAVDDPVLVDAGGGTTVVVGSVGEPGDDVRYGFLRLGDGDPTAVLVDSPALDDADRVSADLSPDGAVLHLFAQTGEEPPVLLAVDTDDGTVLAEVEVADPSGEDLIARGVAALPERRRGDRERCRGARRRGRHDRGARPLGPRPGPRRRGGRAGARRRLEHRVGGRRPRRRHRRRLPGRRAAGLPGAAAGGCRRRRRHDVTELPEAIDPGGLAVDPAGGAAYLAVRERGTWVPTLVVADVGAGTTGTVPLCPVGAVDDVAVAGDGVVWVSGVCDGAAVVWAVG